MMLKDFNALEQRALSLPPKTVVLAASESEEALAAIVLACERNIINAILVGNTEKTSALLRQLGTDPSRFTLLSCGSKEESARLSVELIRQGRAQMLMKGAIETGALLKVILGSESMRTSERLCSVVLFESAFAERLYLLADVGTNIAPSLTEKASILRSLLTAARMLGTEKPKAAMLCAVEHINPRMPATLDAEALANLALDGVFGDAIVEGPISMDIAVNAHAAKEKGYKGAIQGDADILLVPSLEAGNLFIKGLMYLSGGIRVAGIGMGASVPLIISSRGDDRSVKYQSILFASLVSAEGKE